MAESRLKSRRSEERGTDSVVEMSRYVVAGAGGRGQEMCSTKTDKAGRHAVGGGWERII